MATQIRYITILCQTGKHNYCLQGCECSCHFNLKHESELTVLIYELWTIRTAFALPEENAEARRNRLVDVISAAENVVDFKGYTVEEVADRAELSLARDYWSLRETAEDFNLN